MKLITVDGTTYIRGDSGRTFGTFNRDLCSVEIERNGDRVSIPLKDLLRDSGMQIVPDLQKFDNSK